MIPIFRKQPKLASSWPNQLATAKSCRKSLEMINWKFQLYNLEHFIKTKQNKKYVQWKSKAFLAWNTMEYYFNSNIFGKGKIFWVPRITMLQNAKHGTM